MKASAALKNKEYGDGCMLTGAGRRRPLPDGNSLTPEGVTYRRKGCARIMAVVVCLLTALMAAAHHGAGDLPGARPARAQAAALSV